MGALVRVVGWDRAPVGVAAGGCDAVAPLVERAAWASFDFKLEHGTPVAPEGIPCWARTSWPRFFTLWLIRVESDADFVAWRAALNALRAHTNGVGAVFVGTDPRRREHWVPWPAPELSLDRMLREIAAAVVFARG